MGARGPKPTRFPWLVKAISEHKSNECLLWPFGTTGRYGTCRFNDGYVATHRLVFYLTHGRWPVPYGRHTCDTPLCINPRHVIEGTPAQNSADMVARGRSAKGERNASTKLTADIVMKIRSAFRPGMSRLLANRFGVTDATILLIVKRRIWKHVA